MQITITTAAENGFLRIYLYDSNGERLLHLSDHDTASVDLEPDTTYKLEYHFWSSVPASYEIIVTPPFQEHPNGIEFILPTASESQNIIDVTTP